MPHWPRLRLDDWRETRDALHHTARLMGAIKAANTPAHPHWWHGALAVSASGFRTGPVPSGGLGGPFELDYDLGACTLGVENDEELEYLDLDEDDYTLDGACRWITAQIELGGGKVKPDLTKLDLKATLGVDDDDSERYGKVLVAMHGALAEVANGCATGWISPVLLWGHHFDCSVTWFTGRAVPGTKATDREHADEQMTFGFATGDDTFEDAYLYANAYPFPDGLAKSKLPAGASWGHGEFAGAILPYEELRTQKDPHAAAVTFFRAAQQAGAKRLG